MNKRVIHFSNDDYTGAGLAAYRFHKNLFENEISSYLIVNESKQNNSNIIALNLDNKINKIFNKIEFFGLTEKNKYAFYDKNRYLLNNINQLNFLEKYQPEIIIFHWISGFINPNLFEKIESKFNCKLYWNIIDIAPLTGGCHINWGCQNFTQNCSKCPATHNFYQFKPLKTFKQKSKALDKTKINLMYTCDWMGKQINKSPFLNKKNSFKIMIPINENKFKPDRNVDNLIFKELNEKKMNFFFRSSSHKRKGIDILIQILDLVLKNDPELKEKFRLISIGDDYFKINSKKLDIEYHNLGKLNSDDELADMYNLTDLFISTSIEDVGPMMVNEAIISGTPVICFDIGVAKDLIENNENGYIIKKNDYKAFADKMKKFLNSPKEKISIMKKKARKVGLLKTSNKTHIEIFKKTIS